MQNGREFMHYEDGLLSGIPESSLDLERYLQISGLI